MTSETPALRVRCWGTRGSLPSPGLATAGYGGNTSCLEITAPDVRLIFDAGSGIRLLGDRLAMSDGVETELFLTHFHWDHIQGLPFFAPLYDPAARLRIHAAPQGEVDVRTLIAAQMAPIYFPVPFEQVTAQMTFVHLDAEPWTKRGIEVRALRVRHPGKTFGYRVAAPHAAIAYIPDNELHGGDYPLAASAHRAELLQFLDGVDVLYHDAMFSDEEYRRREGWGHSTFSQVVRLAQDAGVRRLYLFHHAPGRTDRELAEILDRLRTDAARNGSVLDIGIATEGEELVL